MEPQAMLRIGDWCVNPASGEISRDGESVRVEARTMRLLLCLVDHVGEVVSIDDLIANVWSGVNVSSDSVYQAVTSLRRVLRDEPKQPAYIETVPRLGYRMVAKVAPWTNGARPSRTRAKIRMAAAAVALCLVLIAAFAFVVRGKITGHSAFASSQPQKSV